MNAISEYFVFMRVASNPRHVREIAERFLSTLWLMFISSCYFILIKHISTVCVFVCVCVCVCVCMCVCVCVCVCVCISFHCKGFSWLKQNDKCNARDQASDAVLRKLLCVKYLCRHIIDNHSRDHQASDCSRVSIKAGRAMRSKRQLLYPSKNQR